MQLNRDPDQLEVFSETKRRKTLVGILIFEPKAKIWEFKYDKSYQKSKTAIPVGPELNLRKPAHRSNKLFPSFLDRIPSKVNPAYEEYCQSQGISPTEKNPITLLTTIGRRGPSTFVFEPVFAETDGKVAEQLKKISNELNLSQWDIANAFDLTQLTVQRVLNGKSKDKNILKMIDIFLNFPEIALWQLNRTSKRLPAETAAKLTDHFSNLERSASG